ncbi:MAG: TIGR03620 family F420-dependent LLM class oxidoreductase [Acidimicrobiia bacterium]
MITARQRLGRVGVWSGRLQRLSVGEARSLVSEWEELGYGSVWLPESPSARDVLTFAGVLLCDSRSITVATGIAVIWNRDPTTTMNASRTLAEAYADRFVLGIGVSHRTSVEGRGHHYTKPLTAMRSYLLDMDDAPFDGVPDAPRPLRLVAALGPRMTRMAGELADGVHPFLSTPSHTAITRKILGPGPVIAVEQAVVLSEDFDRARAAARLNLDRFLQWPNYRRHFLRIGFTGHDLERGGSDALIDALYAHGGESVVESRIAEHIAAGADHVALQVVPVDEVGEAQVLRRLAPLLLNG